MRHNRMKCLAGVMVLGVLPGMGALGATGEVPSSPSGKGLPAEERATPAPVPATPAGLEAAIASSRLAWRLSTPEEVTALLGEPASRKEEKDGGSVLLILSYPKMQVVFVRFGEGSRSGPFTLFGHTDGDREVQVPRDYVLRLRTPADLDRLDGFRALQGVDLRALDLRGEKERLLHLSWDTRTLWPPADRLPQGFDPVRRLEEATNPGLGLRALHARGIDGRGVSIAILDQPTLEGHREYSGKAVTSSSLDVDGVPPQMHGPYVMGYAVGRRLGAAPGAGLRYFALPMWKPSCAPFVQALDQILKENTTRPQPVRVVSVSTGMFPQYADFADWQKAVQRAEAGGVLVLDCAPGSGLPIWTLARRWEGDPESPEGWRRGPFGVKDGLMVPACGRVFAGVAAPDCYVYDPEGGLSAVPPTLAGICALALQVNPALTPARLREGLLQTAWKTGEGPVVNPAALVAWAGTSAR